ncbi:MAG: hypothetical protein WDM96_08760 [Lacunisphaera sp.]
MPARPMRGSPVPPGRHVLQKPFTAEDLLAAVHRAMGHPAI